MVQPYYTAQFDLEKNKLNRESFQTLVALFSYVSGEQALSPSPPSMFPHVDTPISL